MMKFDPRASLSPIVLLFAVLACGLLAWPTASVRAADAEEVKPIKALLITGGCCHDYENQKTIISEGVSARANVQWTIVHDGGSSSNAKIKLHEDPDWAKGFDVVVHNECFAGVKEREWVETILKPHREGTPAVLIHCAAHCYRIPNSDLWFKFIGVRSHNHGPKLPITVTIKDKGHPITKRLPESWKTPNGELYNIAEVYDGTTILADGNNGKVNNALIWAHTYGKGRVFGTTLGHHNQTMKQGAYLDMITNGLLWAADKLGEDGKPKPGYGPAKAAE